MTSWNDKINLNATINPKTKKLLEELDYIFEAYLEDAAKYLLPMDTLIDDPLKECVKTIEKAIMDGLIRIAYIEEKQQRQQNRERNK